MGTKIQGNNIGTKDGRTVAANGNHVVKSTVFREDFLEQRTLVANSKITPKEVNKYLSNQKFTSKVNAHQRNLPDQNPKRVPRNRRNNTRTVDSGNTAGYRRLDTGQ